MLVKLIYVPTADRRGPDLNRMGTVEDVPDDLARVMVAEGSAVWPDAEEVGAAPVVIPAEAIEPTEPETATVPDDVGAVEVAPMHPFDDEV